MIERDPLSMATGPYTPAVDGDTYSAYAIGWERGRFTLVVFRDRDVREVWGDPLKAAKPEEMPAVAEARLAGAVPWRVAGPWEPAPIGADPHRIRAPVRQT